MNDIHLPRLGELQCFVAAARLGGTTQAAGQLNLTQSAVSRSINAMEERLGVRLFHRVRRRIVLSDAGRAMLPEAEAILARLSEASLTVMAFGGRAQVLRLAALPSFSSAWLVPRLAAFRRHAPDITFDLSARLDPPNFTSEALDAAILRLSGKPADGVIADILMDETLVVVAAPSLLDPRPGKGDGLPDLPLLQQATRPGLWLDWFRHTGRDMRTILPGARFTHFDMVLAAAIAGMGIALVPELLAAEPLARGTLALASDRRLNSDTPYALTYPARSLDLPAFRQFRDWLVDDARAAR
ncbi:DNA-binding transcriptional regulator, LysR family [Devosia enhydra]|uniref:DNA-binding transcriptional regulator, LysR family n=1 Tax=Devosia enhydra TaxID=665118 RepID=A0A1K2HVY2_9HYPH|nr:LysR substrate-binding domain-containing protein [Devosia enhydra]SFZ83047.1 DNA-binding transcriptional regulator, LysR family [Devosia enhydra]